MKKLSAILLLAVMVFNLIGYKFLFNYLEQKASAQMARNIDNNSYSIAGLTEIRVALNMPYISDNSEFERIDGSIVLNGVTYNYVARKIENGMLVLRCIPNVNVDNLKLARNEYGKLANDIPSSQKNSKNGSAELLLKSLECCAYGNAYFVAYSLFAAQRKAYQHYAENIPAENYVSSPERPPAVA